MTTRDFDFTSGMPPGTNLRVKRPVTAAQVRTTGTLCHFRSPQGHEFIRMVIASADQYLTWVDGLGPEWAMPYAGDDMWATFNDGLPRRV